MTAANPLALEQLCVGFEQPVQQAQQVFRRVLAALSEPGTLQVLEPLAAPPGLHSSSYQIALALMDVETRCYLAPALATPAVSSSLRFHCGLPLTEQPGEADFALLTQDFDGDLQAFRQGSHEFPDRSATLIVQLDGLDQGGRWQLSGPGIDTTRNVSLVGLDDAWLPRLQANRAAFPCGIDLIFTAGSHFLALPRTTQVQLSSNPED